MPYERVEEEERSVAVWIVRIAPKACSGPTEKDMHLFRPIILIKYKFLGYPVGNETVVISIQMYYGTQKNKILIIVNSNCILKQHSQNSLGKIKVK